MTTYSVLDPEDQVLGETVVAGNLMLADERAYDGAKRLVRHTDASGLVTSNAFSAGGRIATVIRPGGATEITENYLDGRTRSVTGTGVVPMHYDYGVHADGSQWTRVYTGPDGTDSPMWEETVLDFLGRMKYVIRPAFGGGAITNESVYNAQGRLVKTRILAPGVDAVDTLYVHDALGEVVLSGLDVNANGALNLAGPDRVSSNSVAYVQSGDPWWVETRWRSRFRFRRFRSRSRTRSHTRSVVAVNEYANGNGNEGAGFRFQKLRESAHIRVVFLPWLGGVAGGLFDYDCDNDTRSADNERNAPPPGKWGWIAARFDDKYDSLT